MAAPMLGGRVTLSFIKTIRITSLRTIMPHNRPKIYGGWDAMTNEQRKELIEEVPENMKSFDEIVKEEQKERDKGERIPINIGVEHRPSRKQLRQLIPAETNLDELERAARLRQLKIPLDELRHYASMEYGPYQAKIIAEHYGIFRDLFENAYFYPVMAMRIAYSYDEELVTPVYRGNVIPPTDAATEPSVDYEADDSALYMLLLTNPDGHLTSNNSEYLHWMIGNIPGSDVSKGEVLCNYLQPFPPKGTGFHRHVFLLFKQDGKLDYSSIKRPSNCTSLKDRTFSTADFYAAYEDHLLPVGLSFFQSEYDSSVKDVYHNVLDMREPSFEYIHEPSYHPPQAMYPGKQPFDRYYDRYRDKKDLAEEVMKMKLTMISPFKPYRPRLKYPLAHVDLSKPSWLRSRENLMHRRQEQFKDLPK